MTNLKLTCACGKCDLKELDEEKLKKVLQFMEDDVGKRERKRIKKALKDKIDSWRKSNYIWAIPTDELCVEFEKYIEKVCKVKK